MITSLDRILVTHVGSLPRNEELSELLVRREEGNAVDPNDLARAMDEGVRRVSTSATTESSSAWVSRPTWRSGCRASQVNPKGEEDETMKSFQNLSKF